MDRNYEEKVYIVVYLFRVYFKFIRVEILKDIDFCKDIVFVLDVIIIFGGLVVFFFRVVIMVSVC